jgi:hypothetical protein
MEPIDLLLPKRSAEGIYTCISNVLTTRKKGRGRVEKGTQELRATQEALNMASRDAGQVGGARGGEVRQGIALEIGPEGLKRVELGRVRRQQGDLAVPTMQVRRDDLGTMPGQPGPDEDKGASQMASERAEEWDRPRRGDVLVGAHREVQPRATAGWRRRQGGDDGDLFASASTLIQDRGLAAGRPTSPHARASSKPLSSMNTRLVFRRRDFPDGGPVHLHPTLDRGLFALSGPEFRFLRAPVECAEQPADMVDVLPHSELPANNVGDAGTRPEQRLEPHRLGSAQQHALQPGASASIQLRGAARRRFLVHPGPAGAVVAGTPATQRPTIHADVPRHLDRGHTLLQQGDGAQSTPLKQLGASGWGIGILPSGA